MLGLQPVQAAFGSGPRGRARRGHALLLLQARRHALKRRLAVGALRAAFRRGNNGSAGAMRQAHARFDFIAMLPTGAAGNEVIDLTVALQGVTVGCVHLSHAGSSLRQLMSIPWPSGPSSDTSTRNPPLVKNIAQHLVDQLGRKKVWMAQPGNR